MTGSQASGFKSKSGLQRHETLKHSSYNNLPPHIQPVPDSELTHLKKAIIKELQKRLKNHHNAIGEQSFSIHCSEDAFIGIFRSHITRYSSCRSYYFCSFKGENAFDEIGEILNDKNWGERNYGQGQLSFVRLHVPEIDNSNISNKRKTKAKLSENGEMTITWKIMGGVDKENHKFEA
ncbi:4188_t:CDS:2, partial [Rhizophagus irregularis]